MVSGQPATPGRQVRLGSLRDRARPLLVFAPAATDSRLLSQVQSLSEHRDELRERDVPIILVPVADPPRPQVLNISTFTLSSHEMAAVRKRFHVAPDQFTVILLGKDGGEKLRSNRPIGYDVLRDTIDAMPMRQDEMRRSR